MVSSSARWVIACVLVIVSAPSFVRSQTNPAKTSAASISGKVTIKGKGVPGFVVVANENSRVWNRTRYRDTTDETGAYHINLPPGNYQIMPLTLAYVLENQTMNTSVMLSEGESVEDFNFGLVRGGVITGKITDSDGKPLIEEPVSLMPFDANAGNMVFYRNAPQTDDRGVYRAFGLTPGKYRVSVGQGRSAFMGGPRRAFPQIFYPSVPDVSKATVVEIKEGEEASGIDIMVGRALTTFTVRGLIVDEAGKPLPNATYGVMRITENNRESNSGPSSNARGEFKLDNVLPGKYFVYVVNEGTMTNLLGEAVSFEVTDHDVNDVVVKTSKGSTVSGVVVLEGAEEKPGANRFTDLFIHAWVENRESEFMNTSSIGLKPDGSFQIGGLRSGLTQFNIFQMSRTGGKPLTIVRIERDGVVQPRGLSLKDGEVVTALRVVVRYLTGAVRGQVKFEGSDTLPPGRFSVGVNPVDEGRGVSQRFAYNSPEVDSRGRFLLEGLAAGTYEVTVSFFVPGRYDTNQTSRQQVVVTDNTVSEVTITLKPKP